MASYLISYDLIKNKDYPKLHEAIKKLGNYQRILESTWVVASTSTSADIRDYCKSFMDSDDKLFVAKLNGEMAWRKLPSNISNWLKFL